MDFEWFRSFVAVYRAESFPGGARALGLTASTLEQHVDALEHAMGVELFQRCGHVAVPSLAAKALYAQILPAVERLEATAELLTQPPPRPTRIGVGAAGFEERLVEAIAAVAPGAQVEMILGDAIGLLEAVEGGELDLVIGTGRVDRSSVEFHRVLRSQNLLVGAPTLHVPPEFAYDPDDSTPVERWLLTQRWVATAPDLPIIGTFFHTFFGGRPSFGASLVLPDMGALVRAVSAGLGISVVPEYACVDALAAGQLRVLWEPPLPLAVDLWIAGPRSRANPEIVRLRSALLARLRVSEAPRRAPTRWTLPPVATDEGPMALETPESSGVHPALGVTPTPPPLRAGRG